MPGPILQHLGRLLLVTALAGLLPAACSDRPRRNPLDPRALNPVDGVTELRAVAGDGEVRLEWDYTLFTDVVGLRLERTVAGATPDSAVLVRDLPASTTGLVDVTVSNGVTYRYGLRLRLAEGGERQVDEAAWATPGPSLAWVADRGSGLVWQVSPDGRSARLARGRFYTLASLALNRADGSCWVSDERIAGLHRIGRDGSLSLRAADLLRPGDVSIDRSGTLGWVADTERRRVYWFAPAAATGDLSLAEMDASFAEPSSLAAAGDACWVADRVEGRVLLYRRDGARLGEWNGLSSPNKVVAGTDDPSLAWVLGAGGHSLHRLDAAGAAAPLSLPFAPVVDLQADADAGLCWLLGVEAVAAIDVDGDPVGQWPLAGGGRLLTADGREGSLWVAHEQELWKLSRPGAVQARLTGFSRLVALAVDAGRR